MEFLKNILRKTVILIVLISPLLLSASAESIKFCDDIPEDLAGWTSNVTLPKFDPAMGTLKAVDIFCKMNLSQESRMENIVSQPINFTLVLSGVLNVILPSSDNISISFNHSTKGNLSGYDGTTDYGGSSGTQSNVEIPTEEATRSITNINDFLAKAPGENIALPVVLDVSSKTKMSATSNSSVLSRAGAQVCVFYVYDIKSSQGVQQ